MNKYNHYYKKIYKLAVISKQLKNLNNITGKEYNNNKHYINFLHNLLNESHEAYCKIIKIKQ